MPHPNPPNPPPQHPFRDNATQHKQWLSFQKKDKATGMLDCHVGFYGFCYTMLAGARVCLVHACRLNLFYENVLPLIQEFRRPYLGHDSECRKGEGHPVVGWCVGGGVGGERALGCSSWRLTHVL